MICLDIIVQKVSGSEGITGKRSPETQNKAAFLIVLAIAGKLMARVRRAQLR